MTQYIFNPEVEHSFSWEFVLSESGDPIRQVASMLLFPSGNTFYGWNSLPGLSSRTGTVADYIWKTNRNLGRILATHAEHHVISSAILAGEQDFSDTILISSLEPCKRCKELIEQAGIPLVYFWEHYEQSQV